MLFWGLYVAISDQTRTKKFCEDTALHHFYKIPCGSFDRKLL
ncbi:hypothetical protein APA_3363 [Pseudanabaena sp. lw0831]|nr:hypothetical protein APA_3363 [Pseudanabaena sp. lw0831]